MKNYSLTDIFTSYNEQVEEEYLVDQLTYAWLQKFGAEKTESFFTIAKDICHKTILNIEKVKWYENFNFKPKIILPNWFISGIGKENLDYVLSPKKIKGVTFSNHLLTLSILINSVFMTMFMAFLIKISSVNSGYEVPTFVLFNLKINFEYLTFSFFGIFASALFFLIIFNNIRHQKIELNKQKNKYREFLYLAEVIDNRVEEFYMKYSA